MSISDSPSLNSELRGPELGAAKSVLSVSAFTRQARVLLEDHFRTVWIEGELTNFAAPRSGHWYFSLKDANAQVRCAMFANRNRAVKVKPKPNQDGVQVLIRGRVSLYEARGDFQVIVDHMELGGEGALRAAFEALKTKLAAEGLFDDSRKKPLPKFPRRLGVITSATSAALQDVLQVIARRYPALEVWVLPVPVQGDAAEAAIVATLERAQNLDLDVLALVRGGGSLEDLWTFNSELVARAIATCRLPIVSGVGHQTDITIADFVADLRAPTPSAAAELISPDRGQLLRMYSGYLQHLSQQLRQSLSMRRHQLQAKRAGLTNPQHRLRQNMQKADELELRLTRAITDRRRRAHSRTHAVHRRLVQLAPHTRVSELQQKVSQAKAALSKLWHKQQSMRHTTMANTMRTLDAVSPLNTVRRGYVVLTQPTNATKPIVSVAQVARGDKLVANMQDGAISVEVNDIEDKSLFQVLVESES